MQHAGPTQGGLGWAGFWVATRRNGAKKRAGEAVWRVGDGMDGGVGERKGVGCRWAAVGGDSS